MLSHVTGDAVFLLSAAGEIREKACGRETTMSCQEEEEEEELWEVIKMCIIENKQDINSVMFCKTKPGSSVILDGIMMQKYTQLLGVFNNFMLIAVVFKADVQKN